MRLTGCRPGEWSQIRAEDIDRSDSNCWTCEIRRHKNRWRGKRRVLLFGPRAQQVLLPWIVKNGVTGPVFAGVTYSAVSTSLRRVCKRHDIPVWALNQLRHATATQARRVAGLEAAGELLGHDGTATTRIYALPNNEQARAVVAAIG
jgi:integrase